MILLGWTSIAHADDDTGPFVLVDHASETSLFTADASLVMPRAMDAHGIRLDLYGQWINKSHFGVYGQAGWTWFSGVSLYDVGIGPSKVPLDSTFAGTNLGFGGLYVWDSGPATVTFHAGATVAVSPSDWNAVGNIFSVIGRVSDWEQFAPDMNWARGGVTVRGELGRFFYQGDLSLSLGFSNDSSLSDYDILHANVASGIVLERFRVLGELANTMTFDSHDNHWFHELSVGGRYVFAGGFSVHAAYQIPFTATSGTAGTIFLAGVAYQ
jgi:hypothetical protein